jgi:hypothetical protein
MKRRAQACNVKDKAYSQAGTSQQRAIELSLNVKESENVS